MLPPPLNCVFLPSRHWLMHYHLTFVVDIIVDFSALEFHTSNRQRNPIARQTTNKHNKLEMIFKMHHLIVCLFECKSGCDEQAFTFETFWIAPHLHHSPFGECWFSCETNSIKISVCRFLDAPSVYQMKCDEIFSSINTPDSWLLILLLRNFSLLKRLNGLPSIFHFARNGRKFNRTKQNNFGSIVPSCYAH